MGGDLVRTQEARGSLFELTLPSMIDLTAPGSMASSTTLLGDV
jgi:hypothetical protein